jgi:type II restriction enzyme
MDELTVESRKPDKKDEVRRILEVSQSGEFHQIKCPRIDLFLESWEGVEYYIDLKTVKPNVKNFESFKRMLLEWVAIQGAKEADIKIFTMLALPYNPYEPKPYKRLTMETLFDYPNELLVGEEFWDFLGGENTYPQLLSVFEKAGITLRDEIDTRFSQFKH